MRLVDWYVFVFGGVVVFLVGVSWIFIGDLVCCFVVFVVVMLCLLILVVFVVIVLGLLCCVKWGVLVKGGGVLERLVLVDMLFFDKIGMLISGYV